MKGLAVENGDHLHSIGFLAKLVKAVTEICPNVKKCLMPTSLFVSNTWTETSNVSHIEHWERICRLLNEESINLWKLWIDLFVNDILRKQHGLCFNIKVDLMSLLDLFPNWETYTIEEKDETNSTVQSTIRVPAHPSIALQTFLFEFCTKLNEKVPETLPKPVTVLLMDRLLDCIVNTYTELSEKNEFIFTNQNACLQFFFDLKFLTLIFHNGKRNDHLQLLSNKFKAGIDPFDFELLHKYINANVKMAAQRKQHQYGLLTNQSLLTAVSKTAASNLTQEKDPNLLPLASNGAHGNWFTLLPIVVSQKTATLNEPIEAKVPVTQPKSDKVFIFEVNVYLNEKSLSLKIDFSKYFQRKSPSKSTGTSAQSTAQQNLANVKSNAAAFFGAMSQDWFR